MPNAVQKFDPRVMGYHYDQFSVEWRGPNVGSENCNDRRRKVTARSLSGIGH
jgi:hypothetical protein